MNCVCLKRCVCTLNGADASTAAPLDYNVIHRVSRHDCFCCNPRPGEVILSGAGFFTDYTWIHLMRSGVTINLVLLQVYLTNICHGDFLFKGSDILPYGLNVFKPTACISSILPLAIAQQWYSPLNVVFASCVSWLMLEPSGVIR